MEVIKTMSKNNNNTPKPYTPNKNGKRPIGKGLAPNKK